jgi:NCS1 family nucleobase:cation symporter-1
MDPLKLENQTWTLWTWMAYWATDTINLGTWETASVILAVGLSWREAIPAVSLHHDHTISLWLTFCWVVLGTTCVAIPMVLNGAIGAKLHIPFSVAIRASFGYYLAYFCICSRAVLDMFWLGIQGANGAQCITIMIQAIWPSYGNIKNHLPDNSRITTQGMIKYTRFHNKSSCMDLIRFSYFLFWIIQLPLLLIPPTNLRYLFVAKLIAAPITALATMGWMVHKVSSHW